MALLSYGGGRGGGGGGTAVGGFGGGDAMTMSEPAACRRSRNRLRRSADFCGLMMTSACWSGVVATIVVDAPDAAAVCRWSSCLPAATIVRGDCDTRGGANADVVALSEDDDLAVGRSSANRTPFFSPDGRRGGGPLGGGGRDRDAALLLCSSSKL